MFVKVFLLVLFPILVDSDKTHPTCAEPTPDIPKIFPPEYPICDKDGNYRAYQIAFKEGFCVNIYTGILIPGTQRIIGFQFPIYLLVKQCKKVRDYCATEKTKKDSNMTVVSGTTAMYSCLYVDSSLHGSRRIRCTVPC